jgi:hypothetical protein
MSEWAAVASTLIAGVGLLFAGGQLRITNRAAAMERRIARDGVVVSWQPVEAPREAQPDGAGVWLDDVRVHNPGRMPVDVVVVDWHFKCAVQRRRGGVLDPPTTHLQLVAPVLPGGGERRWERRLVMNYAEAEKALPGTFAEVRFVDIEGRSHTNRWPRSKRDHSRSSEHSSPSLDDLASRPDQ